MPMLEIKRKLLKNPPVHMIFIFKNAINIAYMYKYVRNINNHYTVLENVRVLGLHQLID